MGRKQRKRDAEATGRAAHAGNRPAPAMLWDRTTWIILGILLAATMVAFIGVVRCAFIDMDDDIYVVYNPHVRGGWTDDNTAWAWSNVQGASWMPLTWLSLQMDGSLADESKVKPADSAQSLQAQVYHLDNLFWHLAAVGVLFAILRRLTGNPWAAGVMALFWAVHPLRVESVAWVAERKDVLAMFWGLLALLLYLHWRERRASGEGQDAKRHWEWYAGMCLAFCLSLMSKALFVTLPGILLLLDFWPLGGWPGTGGKKSLGRASSEGTEPAWREPAYWRERVLEKLPLVAIAIVFALVAILAQSKSEALRGFSEVSIPARIANAIVSCFRYALLQLDCRDLGILYPFHTPSVLATVLAAAFLAAVSALCLGQRRRRPWLLVGWLWYLLTLAPVIGILQIGEQAYADRYSYLPTIGLLLMAVMSIPATWWGNVRPGDANADMNTKRTVVLTGAGIIAALLIAMTIRQIGFWKNSVTLFEHTVKITEDNYATLYRLSIPYMRAGQWDDAERVMRDAVTIKPDFAQGQAGLGYFYLQRQQYSEALPRLQAATRSAPDNPQFQNLLGSDFVQIQRYAEAEQAFLTALAIYPAYPDAARNLAIVRGKMATTRPASQP